MLIIHEINLENWRKPDWEQESFQLPAVTPERNFKPFSTEKPDLYT
jgi:hypothetical protein